MIAEWSIRIVASASVLIIALIFLFVFREAIGIFSSKTESISDCAANSKTASSSAAITNNKSKSLRLAPEIYNPDSSELILIAQKNHLQPEVYNPDSLDQFASSKSQEIASISARQNIWQNLMGKNWQPVSEHPKFGIIPLLIGTLKTTFIAILFAAPLSIFSAVYVAFFARRRVREIVKPYIEILAGFPSVVIGFFCLMTVASILQNIFGLDYRLNSLVGGIGLAITVIPIIFTITEDTLSAVPKTYREAALALGATEWETAFRVMLPAALPGVVAAVLLGVGRAFGETMIALMATGNAPLSTWSLTDPSRTFAATIGAEMGEVIWGSLHYSVLFFLGALLFVMSFAINLLTEVFVRQRLAKKFQGS